MALIKLVGKLRGLSKTTKVFSRLTFVVYSILWGHHTSTLYIATITQPVIVLYSLPYTAKRSREKICGFHGVSLNHECFPTNCGLVDWQCKSTSMLP